MKEKNLIEIINSSKSKNDVLIKYFGYANNLSYKKLNKFILENNINVEHLKKKIKHCPNCGKVILTKGNKFCNSSCAATYNRTGMILSEISKTKISNSVKEFKRNIITIRNCVVCKNEFSPIRKENGLLSKTNCCSNICRGILKSNNGKIIMNNNIENGTHKGWKSRDIISYPEQFFMGVLNNNSIEFQHNFPINKKDLGLKDSHNYFLDFYIKNKNIDLEIDGSQHTYRHEHDIKRDEILRKNGFNIYRIIWKNINTMSGKKYIEEEIKKFLEFYENS